MQTSTLMEPFFSKSMIRFLGITGLALVYFLVSKCGLLLAGPPGYVTAVWPASGIAVGAILVWGRKILLGVWLGSALINLSIGWDQADWSFSLLWNHLALASCIGAGAALQAALGAFLVQRAVGYPNGYDNSNDIVKLLFLAGPVACLCAASIGSASLVQFGVISSLDLHFAWWTWWIGDTVGVLIFLPLTLLFFGQPRDAWAYRRWSVGLPLMFSFSMSVALLAFANRGEVTQLRSHFDRDASLVVDRLRHAMTSASFAVTNTAASLANEQDFSHLQYLNFVQPVLQSHPEIKALEWIARVPAEGAIAFEERLSNQEFPGYKIRSMDLETEQPGAMLGDAYFPVTYIAPLQGNMESLGQDLGSSPLQSLALQDAANTGTLAISQSTNLRPGTSGRSIMILVPVYNPNYLGQAQLGNRLEGLRGFSVAIVDIDALFAVPTLTEEMKHLRVRLSDVTEVSETTLLADFDKPRSVLALLWTEDIELAGRTWRFEIRPADGFRASNRSFISWAVLASALLLSGLLGGFLLVVSGRFFRIETAVKERTEALVIEVGERRKAENLLRESESRFRDLAYHDSLTGLANREYFTQRLVRAVHHARLDCHSVAVHFFDLDHFKDINDALGHPVGDNLLRRIAELLKTNLRRSDLLARLGGDEFAILQDGLVDTKEAEELVQRTICSLVMPFNIGGYDVRTSTSVGISVFDGSLESDKLDEDVAVQLMEEADIALYAVKEKCRGNFIFHTPAMSERVHSSIAMGQALKRALSSQSEELFLAYQPQVNIRTGKIVCYEALLRWNSPELGEQNPADFVAIAEARGLIIELGRFTLRSACRMLTKADTKLACGSRFNVAVNVSVTQFIDPGFLEDVKSILHEEGVAADRVELELTEAVFARSTDQVEKTMSALREFGVKIAIDDFGTGYSSLLYLKRMPVHRIKVAQEFVRDMLVDPADAEIVRATIQIANALGIELIAEGVETKEHAEHLARLGCHMAQGYYFSRPINECDLHARWDSDIAANTVPVKG